MTPQSGRLSLQLFASSPSEARARRPVDVLQAVAYGLLVLFAALLADIGRDLDVGLSDVLDSFPGFLRAFWLAGFWVTLGWTIALVVAALARRRPQLALECVAGAVVAVFLAVTAAAIVTGEPDDVIRRLVDANGPSVFPPAAVSISAAVFSTVAPYVTRPFRRFGRALLVLLLLGVVFLGVGTVAGTITAVAIGLLSGTAMHLLVGSPSAFPSAARVTAALADLGVEVHDLAPVATRREGIALMSGADVDGEIEVRVYGRDAWDGELIADLWRLAWYRGRRRTVRLSRSEYVEHEGFITLLADRAGVTVPHLITAGLADNGDALIAVRPNGVRLTADSHLTSAQVSRLWSELELLHAAGIVHHRIDLDRLVAQDDSSAGFGDLSSASVADVHEDELADQAQLLALTTLTSGQDLSVQRALEALGRDGLIAVLPYLQEAALPPLARSGLRHRHVDVDKVRAQVSGLVDADELELVKVRRVTWKSLLSIVLLAVAAYTLIGMIAGIDLGSFRRSLADANWWWIAGAVVIGQLPRLGGAVSTMGSTLQPLPFGPTTALQFATCYVNLAVPSSAGRVAVTTRYFQRFGVPPASALSAGVIDSLSEFIIQIVLFVLVFFISDVDLGLSLSTDQLNGIATTALLIFAVLFVAGVVAFVIPSVRKRVTIWLHEAGEALRVLRSPRKLVQLYGGNLVAQILFAITLAACVRAFGFHVPLSELILINVVVSLFAGILPVPGGVGVAEAGLSLGLTRVGVPAETAFAIALTYRFATFYLPPIWGFMSYKWMVSRRYL